MSKVARCRSCGVTIVWCHTRAGKRIPVDLDPTPEGNLRVFIDGLAVALTNGERAAYIEAGVPLHTSHFATCPQAAAWRRRKTTAREAT